MAERMTLTYTRDGDEIHLEMEANDSSNKVETVLRDTDNGMEIKTVLTQADGSLKVVQDKTDRSTPPLTLMLEALETFRHAFLHNAQAGLNRSRYERLKARGGTISMYDMCMDGLHRTDEWKDVPFEGRIVGVPEHHENEPSEPENRVELSGRLDDELRALLGGGDANTEE
jgi:hypothetical protein